MEETNSSQGITKKIFRLKECPENITRMDYYNDEIKPTKMKRIVMKKNSIFPMHNDFYRNFTNIFPFRCSISSIDSDFYLNFRNIFPFRCYSENQTLYFYYNSAEKELILHLQSGWTHNDEVKIGEETTQQMLDELTKKEGYLLLLQVERTQEQFTFKETNPLPLDCLKKIFKKNWYYRLREDNCFIWKQYQHRLSSRIESSYKNKYLELGFRENIEISSDLIVNFGSNSQIMSNGDHRSLMRFNITKPFPYKITTINVSEEIHSAINLNNQEMKYSDNDAVLYANKFGSSNITELIDEIKKELEQESIELGLQQEYKALENNYLQNRNNFNFPSLIIKIYTEKSFVNRRINKILRDKDNSLFIKLKY
jgi:hypothetical protein